MIKVTCGAIHCCEPEALRNQIKFLRYAGWVQPTGFAQYHRGARNLTPQQSQMKFGLHFLSASDSIICRASLQPPTEIQNLAFLSDWRILISS
jgi:hypothetical protein